MVAVDTFVWCTQGYGLVYVPYDCFVAKTQKSNFAVGEGRDA